MAKLIWILAALLVAATLRAGASDSIPSTIAGENLVTGAPGSVTIDAAKTYAIVFLSARCPCSASHVQEIKQLAKDYPDVTIIGIHSNIDENVVESEKYFAATALPIPVVQDKNNALANAFEAFKTPHAYVIAKGKIVYRGGVSDRQTYVPDARKYLREALEDLKQNRPVKTANTRTLGCAIPRG